MIYGNEPLWKNEDVMFGTLHTEDDMKMICSLLDNSQCKRDSKIEKEQLDYLEDVVDALRMIHPEMNMEFSRGTDWYITDEGKVYHKSRRHKNPVFDSKSFDAELVYEIGGKPHKVFFVLKGVENQGGHQMNVLQEIGLYIRQIKRNMDDDLNFIFLLDGTYIESNFDKMLDKRYMCERYEITNSSNLKRTLEKVLVGNAGK